MSKISVVYWSQSGNTAAMAEAVAKGVTDAGKEAEIVFVSSASIDELKSETAFALGCPAMGAEVLEEGEMEPFVTELEGCVAGKTIGLFGSYGWGDGEWMRDWVERMTAAGATVVAQKFSHLFYLRTIVLHVFQIILFHGLILHFFFIEPLSCFSLRCKQHCLILWRKYLIKAAG